VLRRTVRFVHGTSPLAEELFAEYQGDGPPVERILAEDSVLASAVACARRQGVEVEVELIADADSADLAAAIAGEAEGANASMIVVGSRGRGSVAGAVLGSVSHNLIKYATVPVLVVHGAEGS
jgi:nucleotide-binding universal stress UspA family protein